MLRSFIHSSIVSLAAIACLLTNSQLLADVIVMKDGTTMRGEVISKSGDIVEFRTRINQEWTTKTLYQFDIDAIYDEDGDQSDGNGRPSPPAEQPDSRPDKPPSQPQTPPTTPANTEPANTIAIIPLHGVVGGIVDGEALGTFDADLLQTCIEKAIEDNIHTIILDIESPGGLVSEMEAICETIIEWHDELHIIAWPGEALSAAAIITMSCKEIYVKPGSLLGAATIVEQRDGSMNALEAKFASPHYAKQRQYMQSSGQSYDVVAAMTRQDAELWWSPDVGFNPVAPINPDGNFVQLDDANSILTFTSNDAVQYGVALDTADTIDVIRTALQLPADTNIIDFSDVVEKHRKQITRQIGNVVEQFEVYMTGLASINQNVIALFEAKRRNEEREVTRYKKDIAREIGRVRGAGRMIQRAADATDNPLMDVPPEFVKRIKLDQTELASVARLLRDDSPDSWNEAGQTLGQLLKDWQQLLQR